MKKVIEIIKKIAEYIGKDGLAIICGVGLITAFFGWVRPKWVIAIISFSVYLAWKFYEEFTDKPSNEGHDAICALAGIFIGYLVILINGGF